MTGIRRRKADSNFITDLRRICESTNINFLLGAGCSMPAFKTLGNIEELRTKLKEDDKLDLCERKLIQASLDATFFKLSILPNAEYITSEKSIDDIYKTKNNYKLFCSSAMSLVKIRESPLLPKQVSFFVSNYDLCMDYALDQATIPTNRGYVGHFNKQIVLENFGRRFSSNTLTFGYQSEIASANLVKIHGCISWINEGNALLFRDPVESLNSTTSLIGASDLIKVNSNDQEIEKEYERLKKEASNKYFSYFYEKKFDEIIATIGKFQIVLPNKEKFASTVLNENYYAQLRRLTNQLEVRNSVLLVIGFSFADEHIRKLIIRAANINPTLHVIVFCYSEESEKDIIRNLDKDLHQLINNNITTVTGAKQQNANGCEPLDLETVANLLKKVTH